MLEQSQPVYASEFEAQMAGYQRMKDEPSLLGPLPTTGWKDEGGLRTIVMAGTAIGAKFKR